MSNEYGAATATPTSHIPQQVGDDLTRIKGIGATTAALLAKHGITRWSQIAEWSEDDMDRYIQEIQSPRIRSDDWRGHAVRLETERLKLARNVAEAPFDPMKNAVAKTTGGVPYPADAIPAPGQRLRRRLNKSADYGEIVGSSGDGAMFEQDGRKFDHAGIEIFGAGDDGDGPVADVIIPTPENLNRDSFLNWLDKKVAYPTDDPTMTPPVVRQAIKRTFGKNRDFAMKKDAQKFLHEQFRSNS